MKTIRFALLLVSVVYAISLYAQPTADEARLYQLIMEYRASKGLPSIPLSVSLTKVAQIHAKDMYLYFDEIPKGCNGHSWSKHGPWKKCDYYPDHRNAQGMWDKPRELTSYPGNGYEIAYGSNYTPPCTPEGALDGWKHSPLHNAVIINANGWAASQWNAIGVGIYKGCACVWFGKEQDPVGTYSATDYVKNNQNTSASSNNQQSARKVQVPQASNTNAWTKEELCAANTAATCSYMTQLERDVMLYLNLARLYPKKFAKLEVENYEHAQGFGVYPTFPQYKRSLLETLYSMAPVQAFYPHHDFYLLAYCWAEESGRLGIKGHDRVTCKKTIGVANSTACAECCSYGVYTAIDITLQWLIDDQVPSLGHRINCLNPIYSKAGISFLPHSTAKYSTVLDLSNAPDDDETYSYICTYPESMANRTSQQTTQQTTQQASQSTDRQTSQSDRTTNTYKRTPRTFDKNVWTHLSLQYSPKADAGLMLGVCSNIVGGYVSGRYNIGAPLMHGEFKPAAADNTFGINSWSVDGGLMFRICQEVFLYAGVGYESYESAGTKFKASSQLQGANIEAGLIINIHGKSGKGFTITGGYNTMLNKDYFSAMAPLTNIVAGIGFML